MKSPIHAHLASSVSQGDQQRERIVTVGLGDLTVLGAKRGKQGYAAALRDAKSGGSGSSGG